MKYLVTFLIGVFCNVSVIALDQLLTLDQQIPQIKEYLKNIEHPRLLLGVGNVPDLNGIRGDNPFLNNPNDILLDCQHNPGVLMNRSLTVNFDDIDQLNKLAEAFADIFVVVTADFLVTKFACWTKDHLTAFERMLKPGGLLFLPLDSNFYGIIAFMADSADDLFKKESAEWDINNLTNCLFLQRKWIVEPLPRNLKISIDLQTQQESDQKIQKCKNARPSIYAWIESKGPITRETRAPLREELSKVGLDLDPELVDMIMSMPPDTLNDDNLLAKYVARQIMASKKEVVQNELSDKFIEEYVIPLNLQKILGEVFNLQQIVIKKNLDLPQPHRQLTFTDFSISAKK